MKDGAGGGRGLQPTLSAHPQPCARPPAATAAAPWTREPVRPAQSSQILPTRPLIGEPRSELLIGPRIVTPAGWTPIVSHDHHGTSLKQICRTRNQIGDRPTKMRPKDDQDQDGKNGDERDLPCPW